MQLKAAAYLFHFNSYGGQFLLHLLFKSYMQEKLQVTGNIAVIEPPKYSLISLLHW